jgi:hypothetical protein
MILFNMEFFSILMHSILELLPISSSFFFAFLDNVNSNIFFLHGISGLYTAIYFLPRAKEILTKDFIKSSFYFVGSFFLILVFSMSYFVLINSAQIDSLALEASSLSAIKMSDEGFFLFIFGSQMLFFLISFFFNRKFVIQNWRSQFFLIVSILLCFLPDLLRIFFSILFFGLALLANKEKKEISFNFIVSSQLSLLAILSFILPGFSRLGLFLNYFFLQNISFRQALKYSFIFSGIINFGAFILLFSTFFKFLSLKFLFFLVFNFFIIQRFLSFFESNAKSFIIFSFFLRSFLFFLFLLKSFNYFS